MSEPNQMVFRVGGAACQEVIAWQQEIDLQVIRHQLEQNVKAMLIRRGRRKGLQTIQELPEPGEAEPYYGQVGGAYLFTFTPQPNGCLLEVANTARGPRHLYPDLLLPMKVFVPDAMWLQRKPLGEEGRPYSPQLTTERTMMAISVNEMLFWLEGEPYERLVTWGWDRQRPEQYRYEFTPLSVGCEIAVHHLDGETIHLTQDAVW
jgi:hypothetical protein